MDYNKVIVTGNITHELEINLKTNARGSFTVLNFQIACNGKRTRTDFIQIVAYNKLAEIIKSYCKKGDKLLVEGSLQVSKKDSNTYVRVLADSIRFLYSKSSGNRESLSDAEFIDEGNEFVPFNESDLPF